jgi:hypothetical protein
LFLAFFRYDHNILTFALWRTQEENSKEDEIETEQPTYKEVSDIIIKLKENKAPGTDNIPAELIKYGGYILKHIMYKIILLI